MTCLSRGLDEGLLEQLGVRNVDDETCDEIAQIVSSVDPSGEGDAGGPSVAGHCGNCGARAEVGIGPTVVRSAGKATEQVELEMQRATAVVERDVRLEALAVPCGSWLDTRCLVSPAGSGAAGTNGEAGKWVSLPSCR